MTKIINFSVAGLLLLVQSLALAPISKADQIATMLSPVTIPVCPARYESGPILSVSGGRIEAPFGDFYCTYDHVGTYRLFDVISTSSFPFESVTEIKISANYVTDPNFARLLCDLRFPSSAVATIYVQDSSAEGSERPHFDPVFLTALNSCVSHVDVVFIGCDVFSKGAVCPSRVTNSHHVKALFFRSDNEALSVFGSGNFSKDSLLYNAEDWVIYTEVLSDHSASECIFQFLDVLATRPSLSFGEQSSIYERCRDDAASLPNGIEHVVLPFERDVFVDRLRKEFSSANRITISGQFLESRTLVNLIREASHAEIILILDDAYYYTARNLYSQNFISVDNALEVIGLNSLDNVQLRFLQTNHHFEIHRSTNTVHLRSIRFESENGTVVMIGSAHFRDGAWRNNSEVQVFLTGESAESRAPYFDDIERRSVDLGGLPQINIAAFVKH